MTIDELASKTGLTVRTVRSYQTRGLIDGPEMRGRVGYYGDGHLERLKLIQELQDDGLQLRLVERLLQRGDDTASRLMSMRRTVLAPFGPHEQTISIEAIRERFGDFNEMHFQRAVALGMLVPHADGTLGVPYPGVLDTLEAVMQQGVSLDAALQVGQEVRRLCDYAARAFVDLVRAEVWEPFNSDGRPDEQWPQIAGAIEQIRPLANEIMTQMMAPAISEEIERAFGEELREQAEES